MSEHDLESLNKGIEDAKAQLRPLIESICDVITNDLPGYVLKQVRASFIEDVKFAESKSDEELSALKQRIAAFGEALKGEIREKLLASMESWWGESVHLDRTGKTLEGNACVWSILSEIAPKISGFVSGEGLTPKEIVYATPARFIEGKYLPGMIEKYWAQLAALRALEDERVAVDNEARKTRQAARWDSL